MTFNNMFSYWWIASLRPTLYNTEDAAQYRVNMIFIDFFLLLYKIILVYSTIITDISVHEKRNFIILIIINITGKLQFYSIDTSRIVQKNFCIIPQNLILIFDNLLADSNSSFSFQFDQVLCKIVSFKINIQILVKTPTS